MSIFFQKEVKNGLFQLNEEESRHCIQVLRHQIGDEIWVLDGRGSKYRSSITSINKKTCEFEVIETISQEPKPFTIHLAIAPTKNMDRMEWLIEKLTEIGVDQVTILKTEHSERKKLRTDRLEKKIISAMKQSGNPWKLLLNEVMNFEDFIANDESDQKLIAHVSPTHQYLTDILEANEKISVMIGPEGDFSHNEVESAIQKGYQPISLGTNTYRTETAGLVACCMINSINNF